MSGKAKTDITIVVASYHYGHLAAHCLESIRSQTAAPYEILFVDDAAGDCFFLEERYPEVKFTFRKKNLGIVENFNDMLNKVKSSKCLFLGADNWLRSDALELLSKGDADIVTYDIILTGDLKEDRLVHHRHEMQNLHGDFYWSRDHQHHGSMVYNVQLAKSVGGYIRNSESKQTEEDRVLWHRMTDAGASVKYLNEGLLYYRTHRENFNSYKIKQPSKIQQFINRVKNKILRIIKGR